MRAHRPLVRLTGALLLTLSALAACGSDDSPSASAGTSGDDAASDGDFVIRFADPGNHGIVAYAKANESFVEPLAEVGATIEWVPAAGSFTANFDLLQSGEINTHQAAVSPIVGAVSNGLPFQIFSISDPAEETGDGIVATPDSGITTVEELAGPSGGGERQGRTASGCCCRRWSRRASTPTRSSGCRSSRPTPPPPSPRARSTPGPRSGRSSPPRSPAAGSRSSPAPSTRAPTTWASSAPAPRRSPPNPEAYAAFVEVYAELTEVARENPEDFVNVFTDSGPEAYEGPVYDAAVEDLRNSPTPHVPTAADEERIQRVLQLFIDHGVVEASIGLDDVVVDVTAPG